MPHAPREGDLPFEEAVLWAQARMDEGAIVYQRFTCSACGARNTFDTPNTLWREATCHACGEATAITHCGFLLHIIT